MHFPHASVVTARFRRGLLLAAAAVSMVLALLVAHSRIPWSDEGQFSSAAYTLARHGFLGTTVFDPVVAKSLGLTRIDQRTYWVLPLYLVGQSLWLRVFPATVVGVRMFSAFWIPGALYAFWRFLTGIGMKPRASALAVCLLASSYIFNDSAGFARPDTMCLTLGLLGLASYVTWRSCHFHRALLVSNAFIAASGLTHPNGVFHLLGLAVVVLCFDRRKLNWSALAAAATPYLVFGLIWAAYVSRDYAAFVDQMGANGTNGRWTLTMNPFVILWNEFRLRYMVAFGLSTGGWSLLKLPILVVYLGSVAGMIFQPELRRQNPARLLLMLLAAYFAGLSVFNQKLTYYLVHIEPWYVAAVACYFDWLWTSSRRLRAPLAVACVALFALESGGTVLRYHTRSGIFAQEQSAIDFVLAHAGPRDRIVASAALIYGFRFDDRLRDDCRLGLSVGYKPEVIIVEPVYQEYFDALSRVRPGELRAIKARLAEYKLAFDNGICQVYFRNGEKQEPA